MIALVACAGPPPPPTDSPPSPSATFPAVHPTTFPTALPTPTEGPRTFTIGLASAPGTLDPANAVDQAALLITRHLYEGLTAYEPGATRPIPALAEAWEASADGLIWTFHLRPNVRFSDGAPLTAQAAARNFDRWLSREPSGAYTFWRLMFGGFAGEADEDGAPLSLVAKVETPDDRTLVLALNRPEASLPSTLAMPSFALVNPAAFADGNFGAPTANSAGAGPFSLYSWTSENIIHLVRNPNYWGVPPQPDELVFKVIPDDTQRLLALQVGEIEGVSHLNPKDYAADGQHDTRVEFDPPLNVLYLGFNQAHAPWNILDCRLAVAYALDKGRYVQAFFPGDAQAALAMQPPSVWGYAAPPADRSRDLAQAAQHWEACRAAVEFFPKSATLYVPPIPRSYLPDPAGLGLAIQNDISTTLGLDVLVAAPDWQTAWLPDVHAGRADLFLLGWTGVNGDPDSFLCPLFCGAEGAFNSDELGQPLPPDAELAQLLLSARAVTDPAEREALYAQAHARIFDLVPAIPLAHRQTAWAFRANVNGNVPSPIENVFLRLTLEP